MFGVLDQNGGVMNAAEKMKVDNVTDVVDKLQEQAGNVNKHAAPAAKALKVLLPHQDDVNRKKLQASIKTLAELGQGIKTVKKDLDAILKDGRSAKVIQACPDAKTFRDKLVVKRVASTRKWEGQALSLVANIKNTGKPNMWPGVGEADVIATINYIGYFSGYVNALKVALAQV
jgi:hypothetical protein